MRSIKHLLPFAVVLAVSFSAGAADEGMSGAANRAVKPAPGNGKGDAKLEKLLGTVGNKPADAKAGVVATLKTGGKKAPESKTYSLVATGDNAAQLAELAAKKGHAEITGTLDGDVMTVTQIVILAGHKK